MMKVFIILGTLCTMMSVGTGTFGAHGLEGKPPNKYMPIWEKAVNYRMCHGLGLIPIGIISGTTPINVGQAGWFLFSGIVLFNDPLHTLTLTQIRILRMITPIGDILSIVGWSMLIIATFKSAG